MELQKELTDRFGEPPKTVMILVELEEIRALASSLRIDEILEQSKAIRIRISANSVIEPSLLVKELATDGRLSIDFSDREILIFNPKAKQAEKKLLELKKWLQQLAVTAHE
jgi:transcription-repair coupling factor (superfamily II helicase)